jgi:hypothetical protein
MNRKWEGYEKRNGTPQDQNIMAEISMVIFCVLTPNGLVVGINIFGGAFCSHLQGLKELIMSDIF